MSSKLIDVTGCRFGKLLVQEYLRDEKLFLCICDCGNQKKTTGSKLRTGWVKSCGCFQREHPSALKHGMNKTRIHAIWIAMLDRCRNPNCSSFYRYGGRGIQVCERWHKFENFYADMGDPQSNRTIERVDNNGNYEPGNCIWASKTTQANNRVSNKIWTYNGKTQTQAQWAKEFNIKQSTLHHRLKIMGWPIDRALNEKRSRTGWPRDQK